MARGAEGFLNNSPASLQALDPGISWSCTAPRKAEDGYFTGKKRHTRVSHALPKGLDFVHRQREARGGIKMETIHTSLLEHESLLWKL